MIARCTHPEMGAIWSEQRRYDAWLEVELAATDALADAGVVPVEDARTLRERASFDIARIDELWCEGLQRFGGPFLAGSAFCAVDAFFAPVAVRIRGFDLHLSDTALAYADRLLHLAPGGDRANLFPDQGGIRGPGAERHGLRVEARIEVADVRPLALAHRRRRASGARRCLQLRRVAGADNGPDHGRHHGPRGHGGPDHCPRQRGGRHPA